MAAIPIRVRLFLFVLAVIAAATVAVAAAVAAPVATLRAPLAGTWSGVLAGQPGQRSHIVIVVNARETGGSWRTSATCHGALTLQSISGGYHHYLRKVAQGGTCAGGDVDCLRPAGATVYDSVTSHLGGAYGQSGTLRRVPVA